jgi:putative transposase
MAKIKRQFIVRLGYNSRRTPKMKGKEIRMRGPKATQIKLTNRQRAELEQIIRKANSKQIHVMRAKIILLADEGLSNQQIADRLEGHRETARRWRDRWAVEVEKLAAVEAGSEDKELGKYILSLLSDQARSGTPSKFTAEQICQIVAISCEEPEEYGRPVTHWTPAELADEAVKQGIVESISARQTGRFLKRSQSQAEPVSQLAE